MPVPLPAVVVGLVIVAAFKKPRHIGMTAERKVAYECLLRDMKDPIGLRTMADVFEAEGLKNEANTLRKRAVLRELPKEVKIARRQAFRKGMASKNPDAVETLAQAFYKEGCAAASAKLFAYAKGLRAQPTPTPEPEEVEEELEEEKTEEKPEEKPEEDSVEVKAEVVSEEVPAPEQQH